MIGYYTSKISDNIGKTPEGFLICRDAVIGRTGFQTYKGAELIREHGADGLKKLGLDNIQAADDVQVFRDPSEVFHPDTIQSFEGKAFTDNHPNGGQFVTTDNISLYQKGHVQNVRKGSEPLDSGDWPLIADIVVTHPEVISKIEAGERELSSGYGYDLAHKSGKLMQTNIVGNHAALVPKGRAGSDARIYDAAPQVTEEPKPKTKEKKPVSNRLMDLLGRGLKARAADADTTPEELAEAAGEISKVMQPAKSATKAHAQDEFPEKEKEKEKEKAEDHKAKDAEPDDHTKRMHAALDRVLSKHADDMHAKDVDLDELKGLMGNYFEEEKGEPQHGSETVADAERADVTDPATTSTFDSEEEKEEEKEKGKATDAVELFGTAERSQPKARAGDAADGAAFVLKAIKPHIAKACQLAGKDSQAAKHLRRAFDTIAVSVNQSVKRDGSGSYADFAKGATERSEDAKKSVARAADGVPENETPAARTERLNKMYLEKRRDGISVVAK